MRFSQIKGVGVGLASQISFYPPLKRFDGFMLEIYCYQDFKALLWVVSYF